MHETILLFICAVTLATRVSAQVGAIDPFGSRSGQALNRPGSEHDYEQKQEKKQKYTCQMHPEVITDHPGNCPKCGMKLVPIKEEAPNVQRSTSNIVRRPEVRDSSPRRRTRPMQRTMACNGNVDAFRPSTLPTP